MDLTSREFTVFIWSMVIVTQSHPCSPWLGLATQAITNAGSVLKKLMRGGLKWLSGKTLFRFFILTSHSPLNK